MAVKRTNAVTTNAHLRTANAGEYPTHGDLTLAGWVKFPSSAVDAYIAAVVDSLAAGLRVMIDYVSGTGYLLNTYVGGARTAGSVALATATWHYVALTYNSSNENVQYFVGNESTAVVADGSAIDGSSWSGTPWWNTDCRFCLFGTYGSGAGHAWVNTEMAYWRVWQAVLTESELQAEQYKLSAVRASNLWGSYDLATEGTKLTAETGYALTDPGTNTWETSTDPTGLTEPGGSIVPHAMAGYAQQ